jgi:glutathione peroxidase-family protein
MEMYHVNFPVLGKVDVIGENASPAWKYLTCMFSLSNLFNSISFKTLIQKSLEFSFITYS